MVKLSYNSALGQPALSAYSVDTTPKVAIGTTVRGYDDLLGEGEYIYLPGVAGLLQYDAVTYDLLPGGQTVSRANSATHANQGPPVAVALVAIPAGSYGWYQISGCATVNVTAGSVAGRPFFTATSGSLNSAATNGSQVLGARLSSAIGVPAAGLAYITLNRPSGQPQVT